MPDGSTNSYCGFLDNQTIPFVPSSMGNSRWSLFAFQVCRYQSVHGDGTQNDARKIWGILNPLVPLSLKHSHNLSLLLCAYGLPPTILHSLPVRTSYVKVPPLISSVIPPPPILSYSLIPLLCEGNGYPVVGLRGPHPVSVVACRSPRVLPSVVPRAKTKRQDALRFRLHWTDGWADGAARVIHSLSLSFSCILGTSPSGTIHK